VSGYPDPNYGPLPEYNSNIGESCATPKPRWFYDGATFCNDVTINSDLSVEGTTTTDRLVVNGTEFRPTLFQGFLILAAVGARFGLSSR
jgi:hypothetical protein